MRTPDALARPVARHAVPRDARRPLATLSKLAALAIAIGACDGGGEPGAWVVESGYRWRELHPANGRVGFTEMQGARSGVDFTNDVSDSLLVGNRMLGQGAGIALGDVDGDGRVDLFLARTEGCNALYRNLGGWRFEDVTERSGVGACDRFSTGAAFLDLDGDSDLDLVLVATTGPNAVFINDGAGTFAERRDLGLDPVGRGGTTITAADVDGNGWLDLYVANYKAYTIDDSIPPQRRAFNQMVREVGRGRFEIVPEHAREYKVVDRPDVGGIRMTQRAAPDAFYRNVAGRLEQVPVMGERFRGADGAPLREVPESFALGAKFRDLDVDGDPDLYVANDFEDLDALWLNDGRGNFRRADWTALRQMSNSSMGVDIADVEGDGRPDIFVTDMLSDDSRRLRTQIPTHTALPKLPGDDRLQLQQQRNALFVNRGDGTFAEVGMGAGLAASGWSWGTAFLDVDLDGRKDLLVANGHLWDIMDADVQERLVNRQHEVAWQLIRWQFPPLRLRNQAYRNRGDLTFEPMGAAWRFGTEEDISHAIAAADLDDDGDLDVAVNRLRSPALLLRNDGNAPRVSVRLVGDAPNTRAVGARLRLEGGAVRVQEHEVVVGGLYLSHSDETASFAMGAADSAALIVDWRDGRRTTLTVRANRHYEVTTATATAPAAIPSGAPAGATPADPAPIFVDATAELGGHRHAEPRHDDWDRQFMMPNALSQLGPGIAWFDRDGDGDEDLFVGSGKGGRLGYFRNDVRRLSAQALAGAAPADLTGLVGRATGSGRELLAGLSTWERDSVPDVLALPLGGSTPALRERIAASGASTGPLALGDVNGDGAPDLFVGARVVPVRYPVPASSMLYLADGDGFVPDEANRAALRDIGLVSAATFADLNGDGRADLVLALEWGPLVVLMNEGGRLVRAGPALGLDRWTSRWIGVAAGDLDGDGRLDLIATSWGRNTMTPADSAAPLVLFHGPIGARGEEEPFLARFDPRLGTLAPLNSYARMRVVLPDLAGRLSSFAAFADASIEQVLGAQFGRTRRVEAVTMDQMLFLNRGDRFEAVPLPVEAQLAPASYVGIADFDGDGNEDVALSQNFFPTVVGLPRYDAGRGLLLLGDGRGGLSALSGSRSGLIVYGDQRGAAYADADGDGRLDLVVSQNAGETRFFRNRGGRPGLRVRLEGGAANPDAIGAQVRLVFGERRGPVREVQAGSGYWSQNGAVQVFGTPETPTAVWVRWPGGEETVTPVPAGAREVRVRR